MTREQAYIEGFLKRAAEHGFNEEEALGMLDGNTHESDYRNRLIAELSKQKASVPMQALFGGGLPGIAYNAYKDIKSPKETPNRTARILGGGTLGSIAGLLTGAGVGMASEELGLDPEIGPIATGIGGIGGGMLGGGLGARYFNKKLEAVKDNEKEKLMMMQLLRQKAE